MNKNEEEEEEEKEERTEEHEIKENHCLDRWSSN